MWKHVAHCSERMEGLAGKSAYTDTVLEVVLLCFFVSVIPSESISC